MLHVTEYGSGTGSAVSLSNFKNKEIIVSASDTLDQIWANNPTKISSSILRLHHQDQNVKVIGIDV